MTTIASAAEITMLEDAVLAAATLLGQPGHAEPVSDTTYMTFLDAGFWGTVEAVRRRRG